MKGIEGYRRMRRASGIPTREQRSKKPLFRSSVCRRISTAVLFQFCITGNHFKKITEIWIEGKNNVTYNGTSTNRTKEQFSFTSNFIEGYDTQCN